MKIAAAIAAAVSLFLPLAAAEKAEVKRHDYVRYTGSDTTGKLETSVVTMKKGDVTVDLIGAVHIGDAAYYAQLKQMFTGYEVLLFELVDGQKLKESVEGTKAADEGKDEDPAFRLIRGMMTGIGDYFKFQYQTQGIDYHAKNFVHADVSLDEFERLQAEKGESFFQLYLKAVRAQLKVGSDPKNEPKGGQLLLALLGDSAGLKVAMARQLATADKLLEELESDGGTVIVAERNKVALQVFDKEVAAGRKKLGIFYGAAHLADFEERLAKAGYARTGESWVTAWDIKPRERAK